MRVRYVSTEAARPSALNGGPSLLFVDALTLGQEAPEIMSIIPPAAARLAVAILFHKTD